MSKWWCDVPGNTLCRFISRCGWQRHVLWTWAGMGLARSGGILLTWNAEVFVCACWVSCAQLRFEAWEKANEDEHNCWFLQRGLFLRCLVCVHAVWFLALTFPQFLFSIWDLRCEISGYRLSKAMRKGRKRPFNQSARVLFIRTPCQC